MIGGHAAILEAIISDINFSNGYFFEKRGDLVLKIGNKMSNKIRYNSYKYQADTQIRKEGDLIHPTAVDVMVKILGFGITNSPWNNVHDAVLERLSDAVFEVEKTRDTTTRLCGI